MNDVAKKRGRAVRSHSQGGRRSTRVATHRWLRRDLGRPGSGRLRGAAGTDDERTPERYSYSHASPHRVDVTEMTRVTSGRASSSRSTPCPIIPEPPKRRAFIGLACTADPLPTPNAEVPRPGRRSYRQEPVLTSEG